MLHASRAPRRTMEVLNKAGFCTSYQAVQKDIKILSEDARCQARKLVQDKTAVWALVYDNINFLQRAKVKTTTDRDKMHNAVVGNILVMDRQTALPSPDHPVVSDTLFRQVMGEGVLRPTLEPRVICAQGLSELKRLPLPPVSLGLEEINQQDYLPTSASNKHVEPCMAIHLVHALMDVDPGLEPLRASIPPPDAIFPLVNVPSTLYPVPMQNVDESKVDGPHEYFKLILKDWLGLKSEWFEEKAVPISGDNFTVNRIRLGTEQMLEDKTKDPFDKMAFPEPFFGLFHFLVRSWWVRCGAEHILSLSEL